jgi:hypothetical protein
MKKTNRLSRPFSEAQAFGNRIIFAPDAKTFEDVLISAQNQGGKASSALILMPRTNMLKRGNLKDISFENTLVFSLDEAAETTIGMLETGALTLLKAKEKFAEKIYLPPAAPIDYVRLLRLISQARRQVEQAA